MADQEDKEPIKFDLRKDNYKKLIEDLRNKARDPNRYSHGRPVLPVRPKDENSQDVRYIDIELRASDSNAVTVRIRNYDLYLVGYRMQNGQWLEFGEDRPKAKHLIENSQFLGFGENYIDLGGLENLPSVGYNTLVNAINQLAVSTNYDERRSSLRALAVMLCESARFEKLSNIFAAQVQGQTDTNFETWMVLLIHSWGDLSDRLLREDNLGIYFRLPRDQDGRDNILTREVGIITAANAAVCLGLLLGNFPSLPGGFLSGPPLLTTNNVDNTIQGKGAPFVEVFSVRINNIDNENPGDLYGTIEVTDGLGAFYLYNRAREDSESIRPDDIASLTGPYRSISLCRVFTVTLNLMDRDKDPSPDDEVSKGSFSWDVFELSTTNYYEKRLFQLITGKYGSASVYYTMFQDAVQAKVDVMLIEGDGEDPAQVYGTLVARYSNYDYSTPEQKKYYQTSLFDKSSNNYVQIKPGNSIPLTRYMVAVPTTSSLIIEADLWDYDSISPDDKIAQGTATFPPKIDGNSTLDIKGDYGLVRVTVTWSQISG